MGKLIDLTGQRFGRLVVIERDRKRKEKTYWLCKCDCSEFSVVDSYQLRSGKTRSCGCLYKEKRSKGNPKHNMYYSKEYSHWCSMKYRCLDPKNKNYPEYGGRGVTIQESWINDFLSFYNHIGPKPEGRFSIDRVDGSKGYVEGNVRWADDKTQARNQRKNRNNKTGYTGVHKVKNREKGFRWVAQWRSLNGGLKSKSFAESKYGEELAELLAIEFRDKKIWELNKLGAGYTPHHGK